MLIFLFFMKTNEALNKITYHMFLMEGKIILKHAGFVDFITVLVSCIMSRSRTRICKFLWILFSFCTSYSFSIINDLEGETILEDYLICRSCGSDAALSNFIINQSSPQAIVTSNETLFNKKNVLVQIIENPLGVRFEVVAVKRASCARISNWNPSFSWFPEFSWKLCLCPKCAAHLGWMFEPIESATKSQIFPSERGFYIIVIDSIIAESDIKSLLMTENLLRGK